MGGSRTVCLEAAAYNARKVNMKQFLEHLCQSRRFLALITAGAAVCLAGCASVTEMQKRITNQMTEKEGYWWINFTAGIKGFFQETNVENAENEPPYLLIKIKTDDDIRGAQGSSKTEVLELPLFTVFYVK
jgi:hypothetical protein